jgi:hypothetical protein
MAKEGWIFLALAAALIGRDAPRRIQLAWMLGTIQLRGIPHAIPRAYEYIEIPASEAGSLTIDCRRSRVGRPRLWSYRSVQMRKADVERLARQAREAASPVPNQVSQSALDAADARNPSAAEIGRKGGTKSGEKRRDKPWKQFAKDEALRLHERNPALTLADIVDKIQDSWKSKKFQKVGPDWLRKYLSELVDQEELPHSLKKRTGSRPK